jgi:hypothetical protein
MVSISPRMRDSLDYEEPDTIDPRMEWGFGSLTLSSSGYEGHDGRIDDHQAFSASLEPSSSRRKKRQQQQQTEFDHVQDHEYQAAAYGDAFRLAVLKPGAGTQAIEIELIWGSIKTPQRRDYKCLSYCWQTTVQDAAILVDGRRFKVTSNPLSALCSIRKRRERVLIWISRSDMYQSAGFCGTGTSGFDYEAYLQSRETGCCTCSMKYVCAFWRLGSR